MRNNVVFHYPAPFVPVSEQQGILATEGARWFSPWLQKISGVEVDPNLCQEDWGVVIFVRRDRKRFWIGLCPWLEEESAWLVHLHHGPLAWLQSWAPSGRAGLNHLIVAMHQVLLAEPGVRHVRWYREQDMQQPDPPSSPTPGED